MKRGNCVYFIGDGDLVKIGFTASVAKRLAQLQTGHAARLEVLAVIEGGTRKTEALLHEKLAKYRVSGEWFQLRGNVRKALAAARARRDLLSPEAVDFVLQLPKTVATVAAHALPEVKRLDGDSPLRVPKEFIGTPFERRIAALGELRRDKTLSVPERGAVYAELRHLLKGKVWGGPVEGASPWRPLTGT